MDDEYKEVRFDEYCKICKYAAAEETSKPCHECLSEPTNYCSAKPVKWEEAK